MMLRSEFGKFIIVGGLNTAITYGIYLIAFIVVSHQIAYAIAYVCGIGIAYVLNSLFVFRERLAIKKAAQYPAVYIAQYLIGAVVLEAAVRLGVDARIAPLFAIALSIPVTFALSRTIIKGRPRTTSPTPNHNR